jgi:hypothetical protein
VLVERPNEFGPLTLDRLLAFEEQIGVIVPEDYRAFLLTNNGGSVVPADFRISEAEGESTLASFYGLHNGPEYARLDAAVADYHGRIPRWLLPIAADEGGNAICIGLAGSARGRIYFWNHNREGEPSDSAVTAVASSFTEFCAGLFEFGNDSPAD